MAARKNKVTLSDTWRERIRVGVIMQRLEAHVMGELDEEKKAVELSPTQIAAAKLLLSKVIPDARNEGESPNNITFNFISVLNELTGRTSGLPSTDRKLERSFMAIESPILHQGQTGQESTIQA